MKRRVTLGVVAASVLATACAADKSRSSAKSAESRPAYGAAAPPEPAAQGGADTAQAPGSPAPPPVEQPGGSSRMVALQSAASEIETAQRELDAAGGDCRNACRALGSMDRAAGRVCSLTREEERPERCDDAKRRLLSARDRVRTTCGTCPDGQPAVERDAPVPSMR